MFAVINDRTISIVRDAEIRRRRASVRARRAAPPGDARTPATGRAARAPCRRSGAAPSTKSSSPRKSATRSLQRSALAVTALPSRSLERQQVTDLKSVTTLIPNLQIGLSSTQAAFDLALRGIVSTNRTEIGDAAVAFHVDGFYSPRPQGATMLIYDLDRLEALRGPQGTLFGRNANAGVINVITAKPELGETFGALDLTLGNYDLTRAQGASQCAAGRTPFALRGAAFVETARRLHRASCPARTSRAATSRYDDSDKLGVPSLRPVGARTRPGRCSPRPSVMPIAARARFPLSLKPAAGHGCAPR